MTFPMVMLLPLVSSVEPALIFKTEGFRVKAPAGVDETVATPVPVVPLTIVNVPGPVDVCVKVK